MQLVLALASAVMLAASALVIPGALTGFTPASMQGLPALSWKALPIVEGSGACAQGVESAGSIFSSASQSKSGA